MEDIRAYLESKDYLPKNAGVGHVRIPCPYHGEDPTRPGKLYVNVEDEDRYGLFMCFVCNEKGNFNKLRQFFGDDPIKIQTSEFGDPIIEEAAKYYHARLLENIEVYQYLLDRGLTDATILQARLGWADGNLASHLMQIGYLPEQIKESNLLNQFQGDFFKNRIIFPYMRFGRAMTLRGKEIKGNTIGMPGVPTSLYGSDSIIGEKTVVIAEGEIDQLTLQQMGFAAVGVPGALQWKEEYNEEIADAKRVFIIFDQDSAGKAGAQKTSGSIGPKSRIVELPKKGIDVNDWYVKYGKVREDFDYLFSKARGGLLVTVEQAFERWTEIEGNPDLSGLRFNVSALDNAMGFGLLPGQVLSILARTGAGKTIGVINLFHRMKLIKPDIKILYLSLEQNRNEWFERAHRIHNFYEPGVSVIDTINFWKHNLLLVDKNRVSEEEFRDTLDQYTYERETAPDFSVVDYLGYYARSFNGNSKEQTTDAIMGIKEIAKDFQTIIGAPAQANRTGDIGEELSLEMFKDAAAIEETSDVVLSLWRPDQKVKKHGEEDDAPTGSVYQRVLKSRNGGEHALAKYLLAPLTLALAPYDDPLYDRAVQERSYALAGDDWKTAVKRHMDGDLTI